MGWWRCWDQQQREARTWRGPGRSCHGAAWYTGRPKLLPWNILHWCRWFTMVLPIEAGNFLLTSRVSQIATINSSLWPVNDGRYDQQPAGWESIDGIFMGTNPQPLWYGDGDITHLKRWLNAGSQKWDKCSWTSHECRVNSWLLHLVAKAAGSRDYTAVPDDGKYYHPSWSIMREWMSTATIKPRSTSHDRAPPSHVLLVVLTSTE